MPIDSRLRQRAQSLVETIAATGLIIIVLLTILALAFSSLSFGGQTAEWVTAVALAREGAEVCRAIRANYWHNENETWPFGLYNGDWIVNSDATFLTEASDSEIQNCNNCQICLNQTTKKYFHADENGNCSNGILTRFRRLINISSGDDLGSTCPDPPDDCEKKIRVTTQWTEKNRTHTVILEERLTNWR
jgi:hypothetical protein